MRGKSGVWLVAVVAVFVSCVSHSFGEVAAEPRVPDATRPATVEAGLWERVVTLYEEAREQGEKVPGDIADWIGADLGREGSWEYKVVDVPGASGEKLESRLNQLGAERWDCISVEPLSGRTRLVLKRTQKSYLRRLPLSDLMRLIPLFGDSGDR